MKTKRRAWVVAGVVMVLAIGVIVPFAEDAYVWLAYEDVIVLEFMPIVDGSAPDFPRTVKKLRSSWLFILNSSKITTYKVEKIKKKSAFCKTNNSIVRHFSLISKI